MNDCIIKVILGILILNFSGCNLLESRQEINMNKFEQVVNGNLNNVDDALLLFPQSVEDVEKRVELSIKDAKQGLQKILNLKKEDRTFENTPKALDTIMAKISIIEAGLSVFEMISPDKNMRDACHDAVLKMEKFSVDAFFNKGLYKAFKEYTDFNAKKENLNSEEKYFLEESLKDYKRSGFNLPDDEFLKVKNLKKEIAQLSLEFSKNINLDNSFITVTKEELAGIDEDFIQNLPKSDDGKYVLKCDYPTYFNIRENCKVSVTRKKLYLLFQNRAYPINIPILENIIKKRDQLARLLGYKSFAALNIDSQMAKTPQRVTTFLSELVEKSENKMAKEFQELDKNLPSGVVLDADGKMSAWDYSYVLSEYKKKFFNIDEREIAEYFPVKHTINKIFEIYQQFLGLRFELQNDVKGLWHEDVTVANIYDKKTNKLKGILFLDLYPRDNKYSHACMVDVVPTIKTKNKDVPAVIMVIANFPKATKTKPALLKHDDVTTFFHEFGHAMHGLLGQTELYSFSGTNVKRDFVELPSQMFEEWMWDKDMLKMVTSHYKTHQPLPDELINKKIKLKTIDSGYFLTRQCWLSFLALAYYAAGEEKDTSKINRDLYEKYIKNIRFEPETHFQAAFGHLTGYAAKYYGYMWSKVFALDLFSEIKKAGLLNADMGKKVIDQVLSEGGSVDPNILLHNFLGRAPNQKAFLKDLGII